MKRLDALLFGPEAPRRLAIVHAGLVAALCVRVVAGPYREIAATTPDGLFRPPWFLAFLDSMPPVGVVMAAQVVAVVATVAWFARRCPRAAFVTLWYPAKKYAKAMIEQPARNGHPVRVEGRRSARSPIGAARNGIVTRSASTSLCRILPRASRMAATNR